MEALCLGIPVCSLSNNKYLCAASRFGALRNDNDANCTYEGENNVLLQQASNWLLNQKLVADKGNSILSPLGSIDFLLDAQNILRLKFDSSTIEDTMKPESMHGYSI